MDSLGTKFSSCGSTGPNTPLLCSDCFAFFDLIFLNHGNHKGSVHMLVETLKMPVQMRLYSRVHLVLWSMC